VRDQAADQESANEAKEQHNKTFLQRLTDFPFVGEYITTLLALGPPYLVSGAIFGWEEDDSGTMLLFAVLSLPWLLWLQNKGRVSVVLPLIRVPLVYATPLWFLLGLGILL
jgi:hypothetical protein